MILHIGWDAVVPHDEVVAVLNTRSVRASQHTRNFVNQAKRENRFVSCGGEEKSYVIVESQGVTRIIASSINPATLIKRLVSLEF